MRTDARARWDAGLLFWRREQPARLPQNRIGHHGLSLRRRMECPGPGAPQGDLHFRPAVEDRHVGGVEVARQEGIVGRQEEALPRGVGPVLGGLEGAPRAEPVDILEARKLHIRECRVLEFLARHGAKAMAPEMPLAAVAPGERPAGGLGGLFHARREHLVHELLRRRDRLAFELPGDADIHAACTAGAYFAVCVLVHVRIGREHDALRRDPADVADGLGECRVAARDAPHEHVGVLGRDARVFVEELHVAEEAISQRRIRHETGKSDVVAADR